jgi:hypothetical protein
MDCITLGEAIFWQARVMRGALALLLFSAPFCGAATPIVLTDAEVARGLRLALVQGADRAVLQLGRENGFLSNRAVCIPLPPSLARADAVLRKVGMGKYSDQLTTAMNRAAEQAVPEARVLLVDAVNRMTIADAKAILTGPEDAATQYFRRHTEAALTVRLQPLVQQATQRVRVAEAYSQYAGRAARFGLIRKEDADLNAYVTRKALAGLYLTIADEERAIRRNPKQQTTDLLRRVFGSAEP